MKGYIVVTGQFSATSDTDLRPTLLGIIDPTNYKNTVSLYDILSNTRIARTIFNMGLKLTATSCAIRDTIQYFGVTYTLRENINPKVFTEVNIPIDIWYMDESDLTEDTMAAMRRIIRTVCPDFSDNTVLDTVIKKLALDSYKLLYGQFDATSNNAEVTQYYLQEGTINGDPIKNISVLYPRTVTENVMHNPTDEIPLTVPSFYDLVCYNKYKQAETERALREFGNVGDDDTVVEEEEDVTSTTSFFSQEDISYTDIYTPHCSYSAKTTIPSATGVEIPVINPASFRIQKVTQFWEVYPAAQIPEGAFGKREDGSVYRLNDLTGHPDNNHMGLQTNERRYYNDLVDLLKVAISIEHNALSEEVYQENSDRYSEVVEDYCKTLSEEAFNLMWCHTGTTQAVFPKGAEAEEAPEDDDQSSEVVTIIDLHCHYGKIVSDGKSYVYQPFYQNMGLDSDIAIRNELKTKLPRLYLGFDGNEEGGFVHHEGALVGFVQQNPSNRRWIDTLIRLLRWGERKQSMLSWERLDGTDSGTTTTKYWNLNTASVSTHDGNIDNHTPVVNEKIGNPYELVAVVYADIIVPKGAYENVYGPSGFDGGVINVHVPVGVKLQSTYETGDMYKIIYEDIFTYHDKIKSRNVDDARGHIVYNGEDYVDVTGNSGTTIPEEFLKITNDLIEAKSISQVVEDNKEMLLVFNVNSNLEIAEKRRKIISNFTDANAAVAFRDQAATKNIFNSIYQFTLIASQANCLMVGKKFSETLTVGNFAGSLGINPENARIVYTFLNRLCKLNYNPTTIGNKPACDLRFILNRLDEADVPQQETTEVNTDPCWIDFEKTIGARASAYAFCELKTELGIVPIAFAISRDRANKQFVFLTRKELEYLQDKYKSDVMIKTVAYEQKYKNAFMKAIQLWNSKGKNLTGCQHSNMFISSNAAMKVISEFLA